MKWTIKKRYNLPVIERSSGFIVTDFILIGNWSDVPKSLYVHVHVFIHQCSQLGYSYRSIVLIWYVWVKNPLVKYSSIGDLIRYCSAMTLIVCVRFNIPGIPLKKKPLLHISNNNHYYPIIREKVFFFKLNVVVKFSLDFMFFYMFIYLNCVKQQH